MKKKILIYDDDHEILCVSKIILEKENYHVASRITCDNILNDIVIEKPDLILMDIWIPEMGGEAAVNLLKQDSNSPHIPVLMFSANDAIEAICERCGADGYLKKPFGVQELLSLLSENLELIK